MRGQFVSYVALLQMRKSTRNLSVQKNFERLTLLKEPRDTWNILNTNRDATSELFPTQSPLSFHLVFICKYKWTNFCFKLLEDF